MFILILDDETTIGKALRRGLYKSPFFSEEHDKILATPEPSDIFNALQSNGENKPDLIIADFRIHVKPDSLQNSTTRHIMKQFGENNMLKGEVIRQFGEQCDVPVIIFTGDEGIFNKYSRHNLPAILKGTMSANQIALMVYLVLELTLPISREELEQIEFAVTD